MLKKLLLSSAILAFTTAEASTQNIPIVVFPNPQLQYLHQLNSVKELSLEQKIISIVQDTLNYLPQDTKAIKVKTQFTPQRQLESLLVFVTSSKTKQLELVKIKLDKQQQVIDVIHNYRLDQSDDAPKTKYQPVCPDETVQFVIGNNFYGDNSVENEVQKVYALAKQYGYKPFLMDVMNPNGPQPTQEAYENWLSCPNVKGFYNESHGWEQGILLSDGDFTYKQIDQYLKGKLAKDIVLFDSCETFNDPLLSTMTAIDEGDSQQYVAGKISLPFGASERTASCIWAHAFKYDELTQPLIEDCAKQNDLELDGFMIKGLGDDHLRKMENSLVG